MGRSCVRNVVFLVLAMGADALAKPTAAPTNYAEQLDALFKNGLSAEEISQCEAAGDELVAVWKEAEAINLAIETEARDWPGGAGVPADEWLVDMSMIDVPRYSKKYPILKEMAVEAVRRYEAAGIYDRLARITVAPATPKWRQWRAFIRPSLLEHLGPIRKLSRIAIARLHIAAEQGDAATAAQSIEIPLRLAGAMTRPSALLIDQLVSISLTAMAANGAERLSMSYPANPAVLRALAASMDQHLMLPEGASYFEGERLLTLVWARRSGATWSAAGFIERVNEYYAIANRRAAMSRQERLANPFDDEAWAKEHRRWWSTLDDLLEDLGPIDSPLRPLDQLCSQAGGVRLLLAIELFRAERGGPPESLADLVPDFIPALPTDPYAPDGQFRYKRIDAATDPEGRDFLLYTVAADGIDDGGVPAPGDEWWSPQDAISGGCVNCDFIINQLDGP